VQVIEIPPAVQQESDEQLGSKPKFWFRHADGQRWLFKYARLNTGEHWAEKVAAEIAGQLGLPHAAVELARFEGQWGSISLDFTEDRKHALVHGNELLTELDPEYPTTKTYHVQAHTLDAILAVLTQGFIAAPQSSEVPSSLGPFDVFVGYLLLDALIGNTDRHHENWGILLTPSTPDRAALAPTFDHASSLGRELTDEGRSRKYARRSGGYLVSAYLAKARSALFETPASKQPQSPIAAFRRAATLAPKAGRHWADQLRSCSHGLPDVVDSVPEEAISPPARDFCRQLLIQTAQDLLK
jgi:hypothetical protein